MAIKVSNLAIKLQSGTTDTLYASWDFNTSSSSTTTTSTSIKKGSIVSIKSTATWYNGATIPNDVKNMQWKVYSLKGDRAVLNTSADGKRSGLMSPINVSNLTLVGGSTSTTTTSKVSNLDHYEVKWAYYTDGDVWFDAGSSNVTTKNNTYSFPANATKVKVTVKPVSKTKTSGNNTVPYWTGESVTAYYTTYEGKPNSVGKPSVDLDQINKFKLVATINDITDGKADKIEFYVLRTNYSNSSAKFTSGIVDVRNQRAIFTCTITPGAKYRVVCRAINAVSEKNLVYGDWGIYSDEIEALPVAVQYIKCSADSETSVKVWWSAVANATGYDVEYTNEKKYFDTGGNTTTKTVDSTTITYISGLESGDEWFFRVRAKNSTGDSEWGTIISTVLGTEPEAPTTWSLTTTAILGESVTLYWVHNTADNSKQTQAEIELTINGKTETKTITTSTPDDEEEKTYSYDLDLSSYKEGATVLWRVRTKGIINKFSEWSIQRSIDIYVPPSIVLDTSTDSAELPSTSDGLLSHFPLMIFATANPSTQTPRSWYVSITSIDAYETIDFTGETVIVNAGQEVFSQPLITDNRDLQYWIIPSQVILQNNQRYNLTVTVSMDSGLIATATKSFTVQWADDIYNPDAGVAFDSKTYSTYISPFCEDDEGNLVEDVVLSVYRRDHLGEFVEIATDIENTGSVSVTDPHPSLNYARYRIVARNVNTSVIGYSDLPGQPILEKSIIIQWDEDWQSFDHEEEVAPEIPYWTGSMVKLPYNVDTSEKYDRDVQLINYIGRKNPVAYYGTQRGENNSMSTDIPKYDTETIAALRRLSTWEGDVYIREPSGTGYWAQVNVSMSFQHKELVVPVTIDVKRVEGGGM